MLKSPISIDSDSFELIFIICAIMVYYEKCLTTIKNMCSGTRTSGHMLYGLMAAYIFIFYTLLTMNSGLCRLVKINPVFLKDTALSTVLINVQTTELSACQKCRRTDRQMDRWLFSFI